MFRPVNSPPRLFDQQYVQVVWEAAQVGYTQSEICRILGVGLDTLNLWRIISPAFAEALAANTTARNDRVEAAFFQRAVGYEYKGEKVFCNADGDITKTGTIIHVPADPTAALKWLQVHKPEVYAQAVHQTNVDLTVSVTNVRASLEGKLAGIAARITSRSSSDEGQE